MGKRQRKPVANNKKARHDYFIDETYEAGISLAGTEVKSLRCGTVNMKDSYCIIKDGELFVIGLHISPYEKGNIFNRDPLRPKKLLMHKSEIRRLIGETQQQGYSLVPLSVYLKGSLVKVSLALVKGKKLYDKRDDIAKKDAKRSAERAVKERNFRY